jgi:hypothetical protein
MWRFLVGLTTLAAITMPAWPVERVVGVNAPSGNASLVRQVRVAGGTTIECVELLSNDPTTVFPAIRLRRLAGKEMGDVLSEARDVSAPAGTRHRFTVSIPPIDFQNDQDVLIEVVLPPTPGVDQVGIGAGLGANPLDDSAARSFIGNPRTGELQAIDADLCLWVLGPATAAKAGSASPGNKSPETRPEPLSLQVRMPQGANVEILITVASWAEAMVAIYDVKGSLVRTLATGKREPGEHRLIWDRCDSTGRLVASGVYFVTARAHNSEVTHRVMVMR